MSDLSDRLSKVNSDLAVVTADAWRAWSHKFSGLTDIGERKEARETLDRLESQIKDLEAERELLHRALRYERIAESGDFWFLKGVRNDGDTPVVDTELAVATALKEDGEASRSSSDEEPPAEDKPKPRRGRAPKAQ